VEGFTAIRPIAAAVSLGLGVKPNPKLESEDERMALQIDAAEGLLDKC